MTFDALTPDGGRITAHYVGTFTSEVPGESARPLWVLARYDSRDVLAYVIGQKWGTTDQVMRLADKLAEGPLACV